MMRPLGMMNNTLVDLLFIGYTAQEFDNVYNNFLNAAIAELEKNYDVGELRKDGKNASFDVYPNGLLISQFCKYCENDKPCFDVSATKIEVNGNRLVATAEIKSKYHVKVGIELNGSKLSFGVSSDCNVLKSNVSQTIRKAEEDSVTKFKELFDSLSDKVIQEK